MQCLMQEDTEGETSAEEDGWISRLSSPLLETSLDVVRSLIARCPVKFETVPEERKVKFTKSK